MINNLNLDSKNSIVSWENEGVQVSYNYKEIQNAIIYEEKMIVFLLVGNEPTKRKILCLSCHGDLKYSIYPPDGWFFSYITKHPTAKISVVCGSNIKVEGWYDWHFAIDPYNGNLKKHCSAY